LGSAPMGTEGATDPKDLALTTKLVAVDEDPSERLLPTGPTLRARVLGMEAPPDTTLRPGVVATLKEKAPLWPGVPRAL
jgi:hypothetical protein